MNISSSLSSMVSKQTCLMVKAMLIALFVMPHSMWAQETMVNIRGVVTDFDNRPIPGADVFVQDADFKDLYHVQCDEKGHYMLRIPAGSYPYLSAIKEENYPVSSRFNKRVKDARLEFWSWGFIADRDTTLHIRYHKMEAYGVNVFRVQGATPTYQIYVRPMSLTRYMTWMADQTKPSHLAPAVERVKVEVNIDGEPVELLHKQSVSEYASPTQMMDAYLLTVAMPKKVTSRPYSVFRVVLEDMDNGDKGEALYYLKK